jgi:DNA-binding beta-propeller fold protein YncE
VTRRALSLIAFVLLVACGNSGSGDAPAPPSSAYPSRRHPVVSPTHGVLVTLRGEDRLAIVDLTTRRVEMTVSVGRDPVSLDGPSLLARDGSGVVYTLLSPPASAVPPGPHASRASKERVVWLQRLAREDLQPLAELRIGPYPGELALSEDGSRLVASHFDLRGDADGGAPDAGDFARATILDIRADSLRAYDSPDPTEIPTCIGARGVVLSPGAGATAFVGCTGEDALALVDLGGRAVRRISVARPGETTRIEPAFVARTDVGDLLAITCTASRDVRFFDVGAAALTAVSSGVLSGSPGLPTFAPDGSLLYVPLDDPGDGSLAIIETATGKTRALAKLDTCAHPAQVLRDGATLDVLCEGDGVTGGALLVLDAVTLLRLARIELGAAATRMVGIGLP